MGQSQNRCFFKCFMFQLDDCRYHRPDGVLSLSWELYLCHPSDHSNLEKTLNNPPTLAMEGMEEQEQQKDSTFIWDMGLEKEMELDLDCSFQDPDYQDLKENFMSRKGRGVKRKKESVASDLRSQHQKNKKYAKNYLKSA